jgi:hypothetical protein
MTLAIMILYEASFLIAVLSRVSPLLIVISVRGTRTKLISAAGFVLGGARNSVVPSLVCAPQRDSRSKDFFALP